MNSSRRHRSAGQSLIEYVALTALVAIVSIGTVKAFGGKVRTRLNQITTSFDKNIQQGLHDRRQSAREDDGEPESVIHLPRGLKLPFGR